MTFLEVPGKNPQFDNILTCSSRDACSRPADPFATKPAAAGTCAPVAPPAIASPSCAEAPAGFECPPSSASNGGSFCASSPTAKVLATAAALGIFSGSSGESVADGARAPSDPPASVRKTCASVRVWCELVRPLHYNGILPGIDEGQETAVQEACSTHPTPMRLLSSPVFVTDSAVSFCHLCALRAKLFPCFSGLLSYTSRAAAFVIQAISNFEKLKRKKSILCIRNTALAVLCRSHAYCSRLREVL